MTGRPARRGPGAVWVVVLAVLAALAFAEAVFLYPLLFLPGRGTAETSPDANLPERRLRVLVAEGSPRLLLKSPLDHPEADRQDRLNLDRHLFPEGPAHRYYLLHVENGPDGEAELDLGRSPLLLDVGGGRTVGPVDLAGALRRRAGEMPAYLRQSLGVVVPTPQHLRLGPGERRSVLLAYPEGELSALPEAARTGERTLLPREVRKDDLDREMVEPEARRP